MQPTAERKDAEDDCTNTDHRGAETEEENTQKERNEKSGSDPPLQQRPQPADAERQTHDIEIGTTANCRRQGAHRGQLRSDREDCQQEFREHEDHEVRGERGRMQETQRESISDKRQERPGRRRQQRARDSARESGKKVRGRR